MSEVTVESITYSASLEKDAVLENDIVNPNEEVKYGTVEEKLLNGSPLNPMLTNDTEVDRQVAKILDELTDNSMSTYEKVVAVYDYLETNFFYRSSFINSDETYKSKYDNTVVGRAKGFLTTGHGTCTEYSATFMVIMRAIGLECYSIGGSHCGGQHTWTIIVLDGKQYIFDPEIDYKKWQYYHGERIIHEQFCMDETTEGYECYYTRNIESSIEDFNGFETERNIGVSLPIH